MRAGGVHKSRPADQRRRGRRFHRASARQARPGLSLGASPVRELAAGCSAARDPGRAIPYMDLGGGMRGRGLILVTLCLAALIINLDTTIVNVALPALVRQTGATTTDLQWVVDAYNLVFGALILAAGSLADRLGRKGMLLAGLGVFGASSLAGAFATSTGQLIAARAVMGLGAAMMFPSTL